MFDLLLPWLPGYGAGSVEGAVGPIGPTLPAADPVPLFGWPIYSDRSATTTPTFSGGSWRATLPVSHLGDRRLARVARSTDALPASTQFVVDLKTPRPVRVLALPKHTLTPAATVRWTAAASEGGLASPSYDSGVLPAWPPFTDRETMAGIAVASVHLPPTPVLARFWRCQVSDPGNPAGYVDLARAVIAGGWTPSTGITVGAKLGLESATERVVSDGGAAMYRPKPIRRTWEFSVPDLGELETVGTVWPMLRRLGAHQQLFFVFDTADPFPQERAFLCVLRELTALDYVVPDAQSLTFRLVEEL